MNRDL